MRELPALLVGDDQINALGVARNLGQFGIPVYRLGAEKSKVMISRYIRDTWVSKHLEDSSDTDYVEQIRKVFERLGHKFVLYPLSDIHVLRVSKNLDEISNWCHPLATNLPIAETLVNKRLFSESLSGFDLNGAATHFPRSKQAYFEAAENIGYPVFLKPEISPLFARKFKNKGLVADNPEELARHIDALSESELDIMVQEIIPGEANCMHGCAGIHTPSETLTFCYQRIREYPAKFGCGSLLESVSDFSAETGLTEYLNGIGYEGIFDAEFKRDPRDSKFKVIEINARPWWQNSHPSASGINIIKAAHEHASGRPIRAVSYRTGVKWMHIYNDYHSAKASGLSFFTWLRSVKAASVYDIFSFSDIRPALVHYSSLAMQKLSKTMGVNS